MGLWCCFSSLSRSVFLSSSLYLCLSLSPGGAVRCLTRCVVVVVFFLRLCRVMRLYVRSCCHTALSTATLCMCVVCVCVCVCVPVCVCVCVWVGGWGWGGGWVCGCL